MNENKDATCRKNITAIHITSSLESLQHKNELPYLMDSMEAAVRGFNPSANRSCTFNIGSIRSSFWFSLSLSSGEAAAAERPVPLLSGVAGSAAS